MATTEPKISIELVNWNPYAFWKFKSTSTECPICREHYETGCVSCLSDATTKTNFECLISQSKCGHNFHKHCIEKWVQSKGKFCLCPVCSTPYEISVDDMHKTDSWTKLITRKKQ